MKKIITISMFCTAFLMCCNHNSLLNQEEIDLVEKLSFDSEIVNEIKEVTKNNIEQLPKIDIETGEIINGTDKIEGLYSKTSDSLAIDFLDKRKSNLKKKGYLAFLFEDSQRSNCIGIIKGTNDIDILKYRRTDGINYNLDSKDVLTKIESWDSKYGVNIIGCSRDWIHIVFDELPNDLDAFANEVYEFCPDSVDQGVGSVEELQRAIKQMKGVWLWWD